MSGDEVRQAARFQYRYSAPLPDGSPSGRSHFVTVVLEHGTTVEPRAFQVSDLAVALEHDACLATPQDPNMLVRMMM